MSSSGPQSLLNPASLVRAHRHQEAGGWTLKVHTEMRVFFFILFESLIFIYYLCQIIILFFFFLVAQLVGS